MVAIFAGRGGGLETQSGAVLGRAGLLGSSAFGRSGLQLYVNATTGNFVASQNDTMLVGRGPDALVNQTYNSRGGNGNFGGHNFFWTGERALYTGAMTPGGGYAELTLEGGTRARFEWDGSRYVSTDGAGAYDVLEQLQDGGYVVTDGDTLTREYYGPDQPDRHQRLYKRVDVSGNTLTFNYRPEKYTLLDSITSDNGDSISFTYDGVAGPVRPLSMTVRYTDLASGQVKSETTRYAYDTAGNLVTTTWDLTPEDGSIADGNVYALSYAYEGTEGRMSRITSSDGSRLDISYYYYLVDTLTETLATGETRTTKFSFATGYTTVTDALGQVTRLDINDDGTLKSITAPPAGASTAAQVTSFAYTAKGDVESVTDPLGQVTRFTYDGNGNVLTQRDRLGNVVTRRYDGRNRLLAETRTGADANSAAAQQTDRYVHDAQGRPRFTISADGRVSEQRYDDRGQVILTLRYIEQRYPAATDPNAAPPTEADMANWVAGLSNQTAVEQTAFAYDVRGNLILETDYAASAAPGTPGTGEGYRQVSYRYDQHGRLLSRTQAGQNTEYFVYDGMGRLVSSVDVNGGTTSVVFDDAATRTIVTLANGLVRTSTYNKAGELIAVSESGELMPPATTSYVRDKLGRPRVMVAANGVRSYMLYDRVGRKVADVSEVGEVTEYRYDALDRVIATVRYVTRLSSSALASVADANQAPDIASIRPAAATDDLWTWQVYDAESRVIETIDGAGNVVSNDYDASGRLVRTREYASPLTAAQLATLRTTPPATPLLPAATTNDRVTRTFYDADDHVIGMLDGAGFLSVMTYDAAGNRTAETRHAMAVPPERRADGTLAELNAAITPGPADRTTRYVYDRQGLLRYEIDPLNQVVEYGYSSATPGSADGRVRTTTRYAGAIAPLSGYSVLRVRSALSDAGLTTNAANRTDYAIYDAAGRLGYTVAADGAVVRYRYDNMGDVISTTRFAAFRPTTSLPTLADMDGWAAANVTAARDRTTRNYYSDARQLRYTVDAEGYVTRNDYDAAGRMVATLRFNALVAATDTTTAATIASLTTGAAATTTFGYDALDRLVQRTDANGIVHAFVYNANGTMQLDIVARGTPEERRTQFAYDGAARLTRVTEALGSGVQTIKQTEYNAFGDIVAEVDPLGRRTTFAYDLRGQLLSRTDAAGGVTSYSYNAFGDRLVITDARGNSSVNSYNVDGQLIATRDAENYVTQYTYNAFGEVATSTRRANRATDTASPPQVVASAGDAVTTFAYDKLGRVVATTDAEGWTERKTYNAFGQVHILTNKLNGITEFVYDKRGLLWLEYVNAPVFDAAGTQVAPGYYAHVYNYDSRGNLVRDTEAPNLPEERRTYFRYDAGDRLIEKRGDAVAVGLPGQSQTVTPTETYSYDPRGNMVLKVDATGARTQYYYDRLDRVAAEVRSFGAVADNVGTITLNVYDANGNLIRERRYDAIIPLPPVGGTIAPAAPAGTFRETTYVYDNLNRLTLTHIPSIRIGRWDGTQYVSTVTFLDTFRVYDANGNLVRVVEPDGIATTSYYDRANRKIAQVDKERYLTRWTRDAEGNALSERRSAAQLPAPAALAILPTLPNDDANDRVTSFTYDRNGRRTAESRQFVQASTVNATTGALSTTTAAATVSYRYNGLGEVTRKTEATGDIVDYTYDRMGRMTMEARAPFVDQTGATVRPTVDYRYNALGDLVRSVEGGTRVTSYSYGIGGRLQSSSDAGGLTRTYHYDALGRKLAESYTRTDANGTIMQEAATFGYDAAGQLNRQGFASYDATAGWVATGDVTTMAYNAHGDLVARALNGAVQERFDYDAAGRMWRGNGEDGVYRVYLHDALGNQTLKIESDGADLSTLTRDQVLALTTNQGSVAIGLGGVGQTVATYTAYDKRGSAVATILPTRSGTAEMSMATSRAYNAFGEVISDTDAGGFTTTYAYNALGRRITVTHPIVGVTNEAGTTVQTNPVERSYYDIGGRLVAMQNANGAVTTRTLQAGTGYGKAEALVLTEWHPDGGVVRNAYDVFGDLRVTNDQVQQQRAMSYDAMGRVVQVTRADGTSEGFGYDLLGQRILHTDSAYTSTEATGYDVQGRVISTRTFGGDTTTTTYAWSPTATTTGLGVQGAYVETTTFTNGLQSVEVRDSFEHIVTRTDLGGHVFTHSYDLAGRLKQVATSDERTSYTYANTGLVSSVFVGRGDANTVGSDYLTTTYGYDQRGLKIGEVTSHTRVKEEFVDGQPSRTSTSETLQNATASYDAMRRMTRWTDAINRDGAQTTPANTINYLYDAVGNVRRAEVTYNNLDATSEFVAGGYQDQWFRYDAMNRVVTNKGTLANGVITRGASGSDVTYDAAGRRATMTSTVGGVTRQESYAYNLNGQLATVAFGTVAADGSYQAQGGSSMTYDLAGRVTHQVDSDTGGVAYDRSVTYNEKGQALSERVVQRQGSDTVTADTTTDYGSGTAYALGAPVSVTTSATRNGQQGATSRTSFTYEYFDGPLQSTITYTPDINGSVNQTTTVQYTGQGVLFSAKIEDARPRTVTYEADALGQVIRRDESDNRPTTGDPHEIWFRFDGRELGHVSNNGTLETDYATSVANRTAAPGTGPFRNGATTPSSYADFGSSFQPINSYDQGSDGGIYTVRTGDTLQSIAQRLYGDESLWYKIAQANGLSVDSQLVEGQILNLPRGVVRNANSSTTFRPYDPNAVAGDLIPDETSPTQPQPQARRRRNKCGILGKILLAVVAVAVTIATAAVLPAALGPVAIGAVSAAAGSVVSQAVGVATGIQDRFSFKGVALAAIGGGAGAAVGQAFGGSIGGSSFLGDVARGAAGSALSQGIGIVTGLQSRFDFAGVAAAGIGAGAGGAATRTLSKANVGSFGKRIGGATASGIASAATLSIVNGDSFGDNLVAGLPQVIGQTVGGVLEDARRSAAERRALAVQREEGGNEAASTEASGRTRGTSRGSSADQRGGDAPDTLGNGRVSADGTSRSPENTEVRPPRIVEFENTPGGRDKVEFVGDELVITGRAIRKIDAATAAELARVDMFFGGFIAAPLTALSAPVIAGGGASALVGSFALAAGVNRTTGILSPFRQSSRPILDDLTFNGASNYLDATATVVGLASSLPTLTRSGMNLLSGFRSSSSSGTVAAERETVTLYRVDDAAFAPRIAANGSIPVVTTRSGGERALFVNIGQPERAAEFALVNRGENAIVTAVEVDASFLQRMRVTSVLEPEAALNPSAPLRVDVTKAIDQFGLRTPEQIQMLREAIQPGTARIVDPRTLRR